MEVKPELTIKQNEAGGKSHESIVQVELADATVWPKIEKQISLGGDKFDTTIMAYQFDKKVVRFRALIPYSVKESDKDLFLNIQNGKIEVGIPKGNTSKKEEIEFAMPKLKEVGDPAVQDSKYDDQLLEQLLQDKDANNNKVKKETTFNKKDKKGRSVGDIVEDKVKTSLSSVDKAQEKLAGEGFSVAKYIGKFVAFMGIVLVLFYGIVSLLKKGVLKKSRLAFLNNMNLVTVLNTTYVAPKKHLVLVKVHEQVLLLSSDERGLQFLTEVKNTTSLLKTGEEQITGSNFDTSLSAANLNTPSFSLKEELSANTVKVADSPSVVKFSEQIKSKVKSLKSLQ